MLPQATRGCARSSVFRSIDGDSMTLHTSSQPFDMSSPKNGGPSRDPSEAGGDGRHKPLYERRILVVEDEVLLAMDIQFALEDEGAEIVGPSHTVEDAKKLVATEFLDAAILDVNLNGVEVFPVAEKLHEAGVPFLFHTGHATRDQLKALYPNVAICHKPTMPSDLVRTLCAIFAD